MKSLKLFLTLCLVASFSFAFAQSYGFKAGANYSLAYGTPEELSGEEIESVTGNVGFQIGALANFDLGGDVIGLQVELLYETRNSTKSVDLTVPQESPLSPEPVLATIEGESSNSYSLLNLPILLTFGGEKISFYAGPNLAYMISGKSEIATKTTISLLDGTVVESAGGIEEESRDQFDDAECAPCFNALEIGAQAGVVYNVSPGLGIDLRVGHSLTDFTDDEKDRSILDPTQTREDKDRQFYVQLGVQFKF